MEINSLKSLAVAAALVLSSQADAREKGNPYYDMGSIAGYLSVAQEACKGNLSGRINPIFEIQLEVFGKKSPEDLQRGFEFGVRDARNEYNKFDPRPFCKRVHRLYGPEGVLRPGIWID